MLLAMTRASEAAFHLQLLHFCCSFCFLCSIFLLSPSLPFYSVSPRPARLRQSHPRPQCAPQPPFFDHCEQLNHLACHLAPGSDLLYRSCLQGTSFPEYAHVLLIIFALCHKCRPFFFLIHTAKTLIQTHFGCCSHVSQLLLCPVFFFLTNIWTVAVKVLIPICCPEFVITLFVSLHCLLLLYCNKCTAFPYFNLNITVISTKRPTITSIWTVGLVSIISFSIFRHAFPIFHLSLHSGLGGNSHKCVQTCFIF